MKSFFALTLVTLVAVAHSGNVSNKNLITEIIKNIINNNRDKLANLNIPSIDLAELGTITNLTMLNLETFNLEHLDAAGPISVDIKNMTVTLDTASATAQIALNNVQVPEIELVVNGNGDLSGSASGLRLTVALDLSLNGITPFLEDFSSLGISVATIDALMTGIDNAEATNQIINSQLGAYLTAKLPLLAVENKPAIIEAINAVLGGLTY